MYKLLRNNPITGEPNPYVYHVDTETFVSPDPSNPLWQDYQDWLAEGNEPLPADEPPAD